MATPTTQEAIDLISTLEQLAIAKRLILVIREIPPPEALTLSWPDHDLTVKFIAADCIAMTRKGKTIECGEDEARDILEAILC